MNSNTDNRRGNRVVVTGMGIATRIGETLSDFASSLQRGCSGVVRWKSMDERIPSKVGGDMSGFDLNTHLSCFGTRYPQEIVRRTQSLLRATPFPAKATAAAALHAYSDAGLFHSTIAPESFGHILAGTNLNLAYIHENVLTLKDDPEYIDPLYGLMFLDTDVLSVISELLILKGPSNTVGGACGSGNLAILTAQDLLRYGRAQAVMVTGAAMQMEPTMLQGFAMLDALSVRAFNDEPWRASRPFDRRREGFVPSQGYGALVLETLESAQARGAHIYAELLGAAAASDATRTPKPNRDGQARAMSAAIRDAGLNADQINYINAHATSTQLGDAVEVEAIKSVFGEHAWTIPINATKSMLGHCLTAAGIVEFVATVLQMENGFVHPTINLEEPDPALDLDFVPNQARDYTIDYALSNSFGFGGLNASVVVGRAP